MKTSNRTAIIDCGTNTFHLLVVEKGLDGKCHKIFKTKAVVKLGEGGITKKYISPIPFHRGIKALQNFAIYIEKYKPEKVIAFATAALRNANNSAEFLEAAKRHAGINIMVIDGNREAELIYYGVRQSMDLGIDKSLIMDIGGGSVEFIICDKNEIYWRRSFDLGASLLLEQFNPSDPIANPEIQKLFLYLEDILQPLIIECRHYQLQTLVGSSGSFETFTEMILHEKKKTHLLRGKTSYSFMMEDYYALHGRLLQSTFAERLKMKGLVKMRVDMIVLASLLLTFVLDKTGIRQMELSTYALKEGILYEELNCKL